jgi:hypothetical protein
LESTGIAPTRIGSGGSTRSTWSEIKEALMSISVYLAAAFSRQAEILQIAEELRTRGITVTSRWLTEQKERPVESKKVEYMAQRAQEDLDDIDSADILVRFSDDLSQPTVPSHLATGSRMGEMLWAMAKIKPVIVVGGYQCVFDYLPRVSHVETVEGLIVILSALNTYKKVSIFLNRSFDFGAFAGLIK